MAPPAALAEIPMGVAGAWFVAFGSILGYFALRKLTLKNMNKDQIEYYNRGFKLASYLWAGDAIFLAWAGDNAGKVLYHYQPLKLATLEGLMHTYTYGAPMDVGGIKIPGLLSLLVSWPPNPNVPVLGYSSFIQSDWDPIWWLSHASYDVHATLGILGAIASWILAYSIWKQPKWLSFIGLNKPLETKWVQGAAALLGWLQVVAWESGWVAAETARQPFVIWGPMIQTSSGLYAIQYVMLTSDAYNNSPEVLPIGIAIMTMLAIAVLGAILILKKLFTGRDVSVDIESSSSFLATGTFSMASQNNPSATTDNISKKGDLNG